MRSCLALLLFALATAFAPAQPKPATAVIHDESAQTAKRLTEAAEKIAAGKHADAVADLQRILDAAGDDLVPATKEHLVPARWFAHRQLAALPPDQLRLYRDRIDEPARVLLAKGKADRDPKPLQQLLARYFVSRSTPEALLLLGELAFERGEFRRAEGYWRRLLPGETPEDLPYPEPPKDVAAVHARVILAQIYQRDFNAAQSSLGTFQKNFPTASGRLAGSTGPYVATLQSLLEHPPAPPADPPSSTWATFGGDLSRAGFAPGAPFRIPIVPTWVTPIPRSNSPFGPLVSPASIARSPAMHPVIANGKAYLADAARVIEFDLKTGKATVAFDLRQSDDLLQAGAVRAEDLQLPPKFDADYALTAVGDQIYARFGAPAVRPGGGDAGENNPRNPTSVLVRLGPPERKLPDAIPLELRWSIKPPRDGGMWEGAPVVTAGRVLAAFVRPEGDRIIHSVACYSENALAGPLWVVDVADAPSADSETPRNRHELLTLAGDTVVYCAHSGAVVALNISTGKSAWAFRYPRSRTSAQEYRYRGACPPVAAGGRVFVAPNDGDAIYALDAETGAPLWKAGSLKAHSLLGVTGSRLIVAIAAPVRGVRAFDVATGADVANGGGWTNVDDPDLGTFGHGLVGSVAALWPTKGGLFPLANADGFLAAPPISGPQGNLAYADGVLIVATPIEVRGYILDPAKQTPPSATPGLKITSDGKSRPGWFPSGEEVLIPPPAPTKLAKAAAIPRVGGEFLIPISADPPLATTAQGKLFLFGGDTPLPLGEVGFRPTFVKPMPKDDSAILAGPDGIARVRTVAQGGVDWTVAAPSYDLNHFAAAGTQAVCRAGEHHLIAFDIRTGEKVWVLDTAKRNEYHPQPIPSSLQFDAQFFLDDTYAIARLSTGRCWTINALTGEVLRDDPFPGAEWPTPPAPLENHSVAMPTGPGTVMALYLKDRRERWIFRAGREASLSGDFPQVRSVSEFIVVAVRRNLGFDLHLVKPLGGPVWGNRSAFFPADNFDVRSVDCDAIQLYCPHDDRLTAIEIHTGREVWSVTLPATHGSANWIAKAAAGAVIVYPSHAIPEEPFETVAGRVFHSFTTMPIARRVAGLSSTLYEGWAARTVPVLVFDPDTGREIRRFDLPAFGPLAMVSFSPGAGMTVMTGTKIYTLE